MKSTELEIKLIAFAEDLITKAKADGVKIEEAVKVFREVRELLSILTPAPEAGDKARGRRSTTMTGMRKRIAAAGGSNGRAQPPLQDSGD